MSDRNAPERTVLNINEIDMQPYDMEGPVQEGMFYHPLSYNHEGDENGCYLIRMEAGTETIAHVHKGNEDYLILEGELIESDGTVLKKGDFVHYDRGTKHNSRTETGCLLIGLDWGKPHPAM